LFFVAFVLPTAGQANDRWKIVATRTIAEAKGHAVISLPTETKDFKAFRLYPRNESVDISNLIVVDGNGARQKLNILPVEFGYGTNSFAPVSAGAFQIEFDFRQVGGTNKPFALDVWGEQPATEAPAADDFTLPWACMARTDPETGYAAFSSVASFDLDRAKKTHHQEIGLLTGCGELRISVSKAVFLKEIVLIFSNGQTETIIVNAELAPDRSTPWLALNGTDAIKAVGVTYDVGADVEEAPRVTIFARTTAAVADYMADVMYAERYVPFRCDSCYVAPQISCVVENTCTPVQVFFGTNRQRDDTPERIGFGPDRGTNLALGSAIVTVPAAHGIGKVERPSYWSAKDLFHFLGEDPVRHFVIVKSGIKIFATEDSFVDAVKVAMGELADFKDQAFVFIHGFNVTFDEALYQTAQLTYDMGANAASKRVPFGLPFLFSWPARGGTLGTVQYVTDTESAQFAEIHLRAFLDLVVKRSGAKKVHLISHSMGNQVLLNVIDKIIEEQNNDLHFDQIILAAPDVDRQKFITSAKHIAATLSRSVTPPGAPLARNVTLYASSNDKALVLSRTIHGGIPRAGDVPSDGPIVEDGIDTIDVSAVSTDVFALNHSSYASSSSLLNDISLMVRNGLRPPDIRTPILRLTPVGASQYWYFPP